MEEDLGALHFGKLVQVLEGLKGIIARRRLFKRFRNSTPGLCYHSINTESHFNAKIHRVDPRFLEQHIRQLRRRRYEVLPVDEFLKVKFANGGKKVTCVTFDDGYRDVLIHATPVLEALEVPFTVFLSSRLLNGKIFWRDKVRLVIENKWETGFATFLQEADPELSAQIDTENFYRATKSNGVNSRRVEEALDHFLTERQVALVDRSIYLRKEDLERLPKKYATVGNHTHNHYRLSTITKVEQEAEIAECEKILRNLSVERTNVLAIPFGENTSFNQDTIDILKDLNFDGFFMTNQSQFGQRVPRLKVDPYDLKYSNRILPINEPAIL